VKAVSKFYAQFEPIVWGVLLSCRKKETNRYRRAPIGQGQHGQIRPTASWEADVTLIPRESTKLESIRHAHGGWFRHSTGHSRDSNVGSTFAFPGGWLDGLLSVEISSATIGERHAHTTGAPSWVSSARPQTSIPVHTLDRNTHKRRNAG